MTPTLLLIDDNPNDRLLAEVGCRRAQVSFRLEMVEGGVEAIRYLNGQGTFSDRVEHPFPDLIFLDLKMPEMDGFQVLRWIRSHPATRATPVAVCSASYIPEDIAKSYSLGAEYFIPKPAELGVLVSIFHAADQYLADRERNRDALAHFYSPELNT